MKIAEDLNVGSKIQRYMDLPKFLHLLENSKLFLSKISNFDDQLEGGLTQLDAFFISGAAELLDFVVKRSFPSFNKMSPEESARHQAENIRIKKEFDSRKCKTVFGEFPKKEYAEIYKAQRHWLDVCCWHQNEQESMAMWKIYGAATNAVCIETTVQALADSVIISDESEFYLSDVDYIDHEHDYFSKQNQLSPYLHKSKFYSFEQEVRLIKYKPNSDIKSKREEAGSYIDIDLHKLIQSIRVSPEAPEWFFQLINGIVKNRYNLNVAVSYSRMKQAPIF